MQMANAALLPYQVHCPKNNLNFRINAEPVTAEADATVYVRCLCRGLETRYIHMYHNVISCRDRLGYLHADVWIIFWDSVVVFCRGCAL